MTVNACEANEDNHCDPIIDTNRIGKFPKLVGVMQTVMLFIRKLKLKIGIIPKFNVCPDYNLHQEAFDNLIRADQQKCFSEEFAYFRDGLNKIRDVPNNIQRFNLFLDPSGIIRVKSKFGRWKNTNFHPIFMAKNSKLTELLVLHYHRKNSHNGLYSLLNQFRKVFWVPGIFVKAKSLLRSCVVCKKLNERPLKTNQSSYREFRVNPPNVPYRALFLDYIGPFFFKQGNSRVKVYLLLFTCLWSRSINLKICRSLSVHDFLRAFQLHVFEYGLPVVCHSDMGSQIVSGSKIISEFITDNDSVQYFIEMGVNPLIFKQFPKGCKELGGIVESCVKQVKRLLFGSIGKNILSYDDFSFHVDQTISIVNKRPIVLKEMLRDSSIDSPPSTVTPEIIVKGYELPVLNIIPEMNSNCIDPDWYNSIESSDNVLMKYKELSGVRERLIKIYNDEMLSNLICQATDRNRRYEPINASSFPKIGDVVLVKEDLTKRINFPMAKVMEVKYNYMGEVNEYVLFKGATRETIRRHPSVVIPLVSGVINNASDSTAGPQVHDAVPSGRRRYDRAAKAAGSRATQRMFSDNVA